MEFRILGPLDVERGDRPLRLGARRERAVLALLLLQPNVTVSVDHLVDQLWPMAAPPTALHAVHVAISRLRRLLDEDRPRIITQRPGYQLRVEPGELDVETFDSLVSAATTAWGENDAARTSRLLHEALRLWRGNPLADLSDEPFVAPAAARLNEARLVALELRITADLAVGGRAALVGELEDLCTAHPLREGLRTLHLRALAQNGRRSDALRVYRETRALFVEELGVEPGAELRQAHQELLADDAQNTESAEPTALVAPDQRKVVTVACLEWTLTPTVLEDPEHMRSVNRRFVERVTDIVTHFGGVIDESAGSMVVASFGADTVVQDHAARAATAVSEFLQLPVGSHDGVESVRAGVSSGEVVVGTDRSGQRTVGGPVVVDAVRRLTSAAPGTADISLRTQRLIQPSAADPLAPSRTLVGRDAELQRLTEVSSLTKERQRPRAVTIVGEAGIGKTRLVRAFVDQLRGQPEPPIIRSGRCLAYGKGITFWPFGELLRSHLGLARTDPPEVIQDRLGDRPALGLTLGLDLAEDLHPVAAQQQLQAAWVELATEMAEDGGAIWVIEDIHWAEPPLLDLIEHVVHEVRAPLLVLCTGRPECIGLRPGGLGGARGVLLPLEPLLPTQAESLVELVLDGAPPQALAPVLRRAEGNPFFIEELLAALIDAGALVRDANGWELTGALDSLSVPDSVRGALASRVDRLPLADRVSLQAAAVAGREFSPEAVATLVPGAGTEYGRLIARGFVVAAGDFTDRSRLTFKHALTREVVYDGIARSDRAELHGRFADWLATRGNSDEYAALLAHHYQLAVQPVDVLADDANLLERNASVTAAAVTWLQRAGEQAIARHSIDEGLSLLTQALNLTDDPEEQARLWYAIGRGHAIRYEGMACWRALERAIDLTEDPHERAAIHAELALQTVVRYAMLNPMPSRELVDGWISHAMDTAPTGSLARAQALAAHAMWFAPDPARAAQDAYAAAVEVGDVAVLDHAYNALALAAFTDGRYEDAKEWAARRLELLADIKDPDIKVDILSAMIPGLVGLGDFERALQFADRHDEAASKLSAHHRVHAVAMRLEIHELTAGWSTMAHLGERTRRAVDENGATPCARNERSLLSVAAGLELSGDERGAREFEAAAADVAMDGYSGSAAPLRMILALSRDDLAEVERQLPLAVPPPPAKNWWRLVTIATRLDALAQLRATEQLQDEAGRLLVPATYLGAFAQRALALVDRDRPGLELAADAFEDMGLTWHAQQTRQAIETGRLRW